MAVMAELPLPDSRPTPLRLLPPDDTQRVLLHNEVHARPSARIRLPALIVFVAVLNEGRSGTARVGPCPAP